MMTDQLRFPYYRPLPWEHTQARSYAERGTQYFLNIGKIKDTSETNIEKMIQTAYIGALGEIAFTEMLKQKNKDMILDWPMSRDDFKNEYDFKVGSQENQFTIDIKTSEVTQRVTGPEGCNFVFSFDQNMGKIRRGIKFCDYYVQMLVDGEKDRVYFVSAISKDKVFEYVTGSLSWDRVFNGYAIIFRKNADLTPQFVSYFDDSLKQDWEVV